MKSHAGTTAGFTLIELLIVVAIIGILAAIAVPQFSTYRAKAYNSAATSDLRNAKSGLEVYFTENIRTRFNFVGINFSDKICQWLVTNCVFKNCVK
jgi:type IV pilus assembly protein PilA